MFDLKADETLIVAYELWVWLSLAGILGFSIAYLAVVYCKKNGRMCYRQDTISEADTSVQLSASTSMVCQLLLVCYYQAAVHVLHYMAFAHAVKRARCTK